MIRCPVYRPGAYYGRVLKSDPSTWKDPRHREGARAESLAADALRRQGYQVLEQRFRYRHSDVDLVARRGAVIVFVEVKARADDRYGAAAEAVTARKQANLVRAASVWLSRHARSWDAVRFDVITVAGGKMEWLQDAFRPGWR
jgi:putative endonuclease